MLHSYFKFHPVGQGGFYSGALKLHSNIHNNEFNFVYDCGTLSERNKLDSSIKFYRNKIRYKKLDILFISHLDDDHVNGINELLADIRCENIYLPYLSPFERLFIAIRHNQKDTHNFDDFINFIDNPANYILSITNADIGKINFIKGNSEKDFPIESNPEKPLNSENFDIEFIDNLELLAKDEHNEEMLSLIQNPRIAFKKANGKLKLGVLWEFFLYNEPGNNNQIVNLIDSIEEIYGLRINEQLSQTDLNTILSNKENLKKLRIKFRSIFKNLNKTGLVVQHKPLSYTNSFLAKEQNFYVNSEHYFNLFHRRFRRFDSKNINPTEYNWGVTLLTGDIGLDQINNSIYIENHLKHVQVFQVPHHGSNKGWNSHYLENLNNKGLTTSIINFGYGNTYGHPKPNVLEDLDNDNFDIRFCNQFESFEYRIQLYL